MKPLPAVNIQWPISELILSGSKTIETRTYPIPDKYLNRELYLIETPGKNGKFKSRITAIISFKSCFKYSSCKEFYKDINRHCVDKNSPWAWEASHPKWGWEIKSIKALTKPITYEGKKGIKFTESVTP